MVVFNAVVVASATPAAGFEGDGAEGGGELARFAAYLYFSRHTLDPLFLFMLHGDFNSKIKPLLANNQSCVVVVLLKVLSKITDPLVYKIENKRFFKNVMPTVFFCRVTQKCPNQIIFAIHVFGCLRGRRS